MAEDSIPQTKTCTKCGAEKPATFQHFDNYRDRGIVRQRAFCRDCLNARTRAYRAANQDKVAVWERRNRERNRGAGSDFEKRRNAARDKAKARDDLKQWKADNPDRVRAMETARNERIRLLRQTDPDFRERLNKKSREWRARKRRFDGEFREKCNAATREWHSRNKEQMRDYYRVRAACRRENDIGYRIMCALRARVHKALKGACKSESVSALLGCSLDEARDYIEKQFQDGMTWENWGRGWGDTREWHLDHVKALSSFDLTDPREMAQACHYTNLQPLWSKDNLAKGASNGN